MKAILKKYDFQEQAQKPGNSPPPKDSSKIYFFLVAIAALLATNIYFYFKYKDSDARIAELSDDRIRVGAVIDRMESDLNSASYNNGVQLTSSMKLEEETARAKIALLRFKLSKNQLDRKEINQAWQDVKALQLLLSKHISAIKLLKQKNTQIGKERDSLLNTIKDTRGKVAKLQSQKSSLQDLVKIASYLKISSFSVNGVSLHSNGEENTETRARRCDQFKISLSIADNPVIKKGNYDLYMRIIDPNGNLIIDSNNVFKLGDEDMQYTLKTNIYFSNDGKLYNFSWTPSERIKKGTYTFVLYSDNSLMGRSSVTLK
ncbi:hypothetical protein SAMN05216436_12257 [bacterium A37T11]|nr:hypothetical protein SAMN05216436_12257 [bacterium A37T11]